MEIFDALYDSDEIRYIGAMMNEQVYMADGLREQVARRV